MTRSSPIGVFDSGLGGLSVLRELRRALPVESFVYLGDVARLPYGTKSEAAVTRYARQCLGFLIRQEVKMIVIACNTATAMALGSLREELEIPVHGVIESGVRAGLERTRSGKILVLGTEATVKSEAYPAEFRRQHPSTSVAQIACPLLVPLAEEGWFDHDVTERIIREYLREYLERADAAYDVIVLGCTHYPLLERSFRRVVGEKIALVHGASLLAREVRASLSERSLLAPAEASGTLHFYATDPIPKALPILRSLFCHPIDFELVDL